MPQTLPPHRQYCCPYLGLEADRASIFTEATEEHRCYVMGRRQSIDLGHQVIYCLTSTFETCPRFTPLPSPAIAPPPSPAQTLADSSWEGATLAPPRRLPSRIMEFLGKMTVPQLAVWIVIALLTLAIVYLYLNMAQPLTESTPPTGAVLAVSVPTPSPTETPLSPTATPEVAFTPAAPTPIAALPPGRTQALLYPATSAVGWVSSGDRFNHFGDRNLHAGVFEGHTYYGAMQFSLASIPVGSRIEQAALELVGLNAEQLGTSGTWTLRLLGSEADKNWAVATYDQIHDAPVLDTIPPELKPQDLIVRQVNVFTFTVAQLAELERRLETGLVSFRLDGPTQGANNLFTWDTGYGGGFGNRPVLRLIYQLPPTPTPIVVAAIPATPTPANVVTAAALAATATYEATATGTPTPLPSNVVTATPPAVVTNTPIPGNTATAEWMAIVATAEAFLNGTPTPLPTDVWTATPTPTYAIVTSTPTPENIFTVAAWAAAATRVAATIGTYTPVPTNWLTPIIVTPKPTPANAATAAYQNALATAEAIAFGTPTPTPINVWTVTPTPIYVLLGGEIPTPIPTPTPTATPQPVPSELVGKIAFLSDRATLANDPNAEPLSFPLVYVINPDGTGLALLSDRWPYDQAVQRDQFSADQRYRVFVKDALINTQGAIPTGGWFLLQIRLPALFFYDFFYKVEGQITQFNASLVGWDDTWLTTHSVDCRSAGETKCHGIAYEPAWSPTAEQIAFVSNDSSYDEIWVINRDGSGARQLTRDQRNWWNKHPSWSPDGSKVVFWSNRTGHRQIWVMDADGNNLYSLSRTGFNDWDPVWIKYTDLPRDPTKVE